MIRYVRGAQAFVSPNESSPADVLACAKLNTALLEVRGLLDLKRQTGRFSHGLLVDLATSSLDRSVHIHGILDEIGMLEGTDLRTSMTKKPSRMRHALKGLWHKHYSQASFIPRNLAEEAERMSKDGRWEAMFAPHFGKYIHEIIDQITHEIVEEAYKRRARDRRITGEFIVYERQSDGSNYYLTIGKHGEWDAIRARVDAYKKFDTEE